MIYDIQKWTSNDLSTSYIKHPSWCFDNNHVIGVFLLGQSASWKHDQEGKDPYLCTLREFLKICPPCLIIIQSCHFDYRINNLSHTMAAWFAFRALFTWSRRITCAKDHRLFILITHKSTGNWSTWKALDWGTECAGKRNGPSQFRVISGVLWRLSELEIYNV